MNYLGKGLLIGYKTYKKDNADKHIYYVLNGNKNDKGLYDECEFITIIQDEQTLAELKPQRVTFEVASQSFGGRVMQRFLNIQAEKEGK